jgi:hypothetical protein
MMRSICLIAALLVGTLSTGCVTRRYLITSDPPGALVYRDGQPIGATPVEEPFIYYGKYRFRLVKDGYAPLDVEPELVAPWYQWPGVDFVTENFVPYTFRDVQGLHFQLQPLEAMRPDDIRARAENLRSRGKAIQTPPGTEAAPKIQRAPAVSPPPPATPPPAGTLPPPVPTPAGPVTNRPVSSRGIAEESPSPSQSAPSPLPSGVKGFPTSTSRLDGSSP